MSDTAMEFFVTSIFGANTRQPMLSISFGPKGFAREIVKISPEDGVALAMNLLQAAEAAISDAFLVSFAENKLGASTEQAAILMREFREWRTAREERKDGPG